ncbi:hypothetical protein Athai_45810 [Actinocatenispora thailandica]|uniref:DUF1795 domain-containing protein n=1 Tax=Actinocatenispora thailandica TaxID=227318 RepID=A0A7R7DSN1_9ACTN|nr:hypothetical protein [Actinocatenispora thailandica]BCJ37078.1 hypothetical protein Athai_45810 [Actinocatenispora thailandica]
MTASEAEEPGGVTGNGLVDFRHPRLPFRLDLPDDWTLLVDRWPGIALLAREPAGHWPRTNLVVITDRIPVNMAESRWHQETEASLGAHLQRFRLLDREVETVGEVSTLRRLATHRLWDSEEPLTFDQCVLVAEGVAYTLTLTGHTLLYPELSGLFDRIRASFRVGRSEPE